MRVPSKKFDRRIQPTAKRQQDTAPPRERFSLHFDKGHARHALRETGTVDRRLHWMPATDRRKSQDALFGNRSKTKVLPKPNQRTRADSNSCNRQVYFPITIVLKGKTESAHRLSTREAAYPKVSASRYSDKIPAARHAGEEDLTANIFVRITNSILDLSEVVPYRAEYGIHG